MLTGARHIAADRRVSPKSLGGTCKHHPDDLTKPLDTGNVWDRFIEGADDPNTDTVRQRKVVLSHIALLAAALYLRVIPSLATAYGLSTKETEAWLQPAFFG